MVGQCRPRGRRQGDSGWPLSPLWPVARCLQQNGAEMPGEGEGDCRLPAGSAAPPDLSYLVLAYRRFPQ